MSVHVVKRFAILDLEPDADQFKLQVMPRDRPHAGIGLRGGSLQGRGNATAAGSPVLRRTARLVSPWWLELARAV